MACATPRYQESADLLDCPVKVEISSTSTRSFVRPRCCRCSCYRFNTPVLASSAVSTRFATCGTCCQVTTLERSSWLADLFPGKHQVGVKVGLTVCAKYRFDMGQKLGFLQLVRTSMPSLTHQRADLLKPSQWQGREAGELWPSSHIILW
jgi:hypothetical protein